MTDQLTPKFVDMLDELHQSLRKIEILDPVELYRTLVDLADRVADDAHLPAQAHKLKLVSVPELADLPEPGWLIEGLVPDRALTTIYGPPGAGKTFLALAISLSVATGVDMLGHRVRRRCRVLYVAAEGVYGLHRRIEAWRTQFAADDDAINDRLWLAPTAVNLFDANSVDVLSRAVSSVRADVVVIDTLARCTVGAEENSAKDMTTVVSNIDRLRVATGVGVILIHHSGKDIGRGPRGSNALDGAVDAELRVANNRVTVTKMKEAAVVDPVPFRLVSVANSMALVPATSSEISLTPTQMKALSVLRDLCVDGVTVTKQQWTKAAHLPEATFYKVCRALLEASPNPLLEKIGDLQSARYRPAAAGQGNPPHVEADPLRPSEPSPSQNEMNLIPLSPPPTLRGGEGQTTRSWSELT